MGNNILFIRASIGDKAVYIKIPAFLIEPIVDALHDRHYVVTKTEGQEWEDAITIGDAYEIDTANEVEEFLSNNIKYLSLKQE